MAKIDLTKLSFTDLSAEEVEQIVGVGDATANVQFLVKALTGLEIGQGRKIGPFANPNIAGTFRSSYLGNACSVLGWGKKDESGKVVTRRIKADVVPLDPEQPTGPCLLRIVRLT